MLSRKAEISADENPPKRRRKMALCDEDTGTAAACFNSLNRDCVVTIMSFIDDLDDVDSLAVCNRVCSEARRNESLDQTRTGTIVCSEKTTFQSICNAAQEGRWSQVFSGNRTRAKIIGLENTSGILRDQSPLNGVTSYVVLADSWKTKILNHYTSVLLSRMFQNATDIDLSHMKVSLYSIVNICRRSPGTRVTLTGASNLDPVYPFPGIVGSDKVIELDMDSYVFNASRGQARTMLRDDASAPPHYILRDFPHLERVSCKRATWFHVSNLSDRRPITQNMLICLARHHPSLRWLRSDLTAENVAMLKQERPHITFVSD